jgi:predicted ABC-type ATPase
MIDNISPENIKYAIKKYTKGGSVMPDDVKAELKEFRENIETASEEDKKYLQKAIDSIVSKYPDQEDINFIDNEDNSIENLYGGNWYKKNNTKLLGNIKIDKSRYGKEIQVLTGDITVLNNIDAPDDFDQFIKNINIGISDIKTTVSESILKVENQQFVVKIIEQSNNDIGKKAVAKKVKKEESLNEDYEAPQPKLQTYEQIYSILNDKISNEELKAYIYYKDSINQKLSDAWYEMAKYGEDTRSKNQKIKDWVNEGILFYYKGSYLPLPIYASGDIYEKISRIVKGGENSGQDIDFITENYGEEVLKNQLVVLNNSFKKVYENRLTITGNDDAKSLILKPISKFAKNHFINNINSIDVFKWWASGKAENKGKPDFYKLDGRTYQQDTFDKLSLTEAYCLWLTINRNKIDFKGNLSYSDIIYFYIEKRSKQAPSHLSDAQVEKWKAQMARTKAKAAEEGNRLFLLFLKEELSLEQKVTIETQWNSQFNNYLKPDFLKIPVAFNLAKSYYDEDPFIVKDEKREAVSFIFNEGSGCLAYDVGVGKTMSAIMVMEQFIIAGYSKRPFVVVPNQTYKQWLSEIKGLLPHRKINGLFNLGVDYSDEILDENNNVRKLDEGSITVLTYEGFARLGFNQKTESDLLSELYEILNQGGADEMMSEKKKASFYSKLESLIGKGLKGTNVEIESLGLDFVCFDEAHALKKVFTSVKGEAESSGKKAKQQYKIQAGSPSDTALKGFMISQYILKNNNNRNVLMLTATPFTNSPLEVFSMLSMVAYNQLDSLGLKNITDFFDNYIDVNSELIVNHKLQPQYKEIVKGFNNLPSLQKIILRYFNYKEGDDIGVVRPNKIVIPYTKKLINNEIVKLSKEEEVTCNIEMSFAQKRFMADVVAYAEGKGELGYAKHSNEDDLDAEQLNDSDADTIDDNSLTDKEKSGVRALRSMNFARNIALSPYLYEYNDLGEPTYLEYINTSPKLKYVMECIKSVKKYHEERNEPMSGQVIYMDRGLKYFNLIMDYLIYEVGFEKHEVGEITAKMSVDKKRIAQDSFLGRKYNEKTKEYENISDSQRMKVLLGSSSIKEGINLQKKSTVLYNCFLDWNPTDMIQLQGRIWRQQNEFMNVRIVNPLMIDSIDIFMFQKLEEKTARINSIWSNDGKSVLRIEEIDPQEIKYALIKDPKVLALFEVEVKNTKIQDDVNSLKSIQDRLIEYKRNVSQLDYLKDDINKIITDFAASKKDLDIIQKVNYLINFFKTEYPKDDQGKVMIGSYERKYQMQEINKKFKPEDISNYEKPFRPYWLDRAIEYKRLIEKENKDLLNPRDIKLENIDSYIEESKAKILALQDEAKFLASPEFIDKRTEEIILEREKNKFELKSIPTLINEFERLNYLLSIKRLKEPVKEKVTVYDSCELIDESGVRKIDDESIRKLTECVEALPQTKLSHIDENEQYTDERKLLHYEIINELKKQISCIKNDKPIAILTGGSPASGKSSFLKTYAPYLLNEAIFKIDADEIRAKLPEYKGWNATATHAETKDIVNTLLTDKEIGVPCDFDLIYDGTMNSTKNYLPLIGTLKRLGYQVFIVYMDRVPYAEVKKRMLERYQKTGRFVPVSVIDDFFGKGKEALNDLKKIVDGYMVVDASSRDYNIIEKGGIELPHDRNYNAISEPNRVSKIKNKLIQLAKLI